MATFKGFSGGVMFQRGGSRCIYFTRRNNNSKRNVGSSGVFIWVFVLLTNLTAEAATDPMVGGHHGGIVDKQIQHQLIPTMGVAHQEDEPFLLNEIEEDVHCEWKTNYLAFIAIFNHTRPSTFLFLQAVNC